MPRSSCLTGREVVIVEAARTAIGRGHAAKGAFRDVHPNVLRSDGALALITMCTAGGTGTGTILQRI